jgi:hypothetical protein
MSDISPNDILIHVLTGLTLGGGSAGAPTLDEALIGKEVRADRWKIFDWAEQADPPIEEQPTIVYPPKLLYQSININIPTPPEIPERRLPKEEDGQTDTKTMGASISVKESLKNRKFGKLLWNPIKTGKQRLRFGSDPNLANKLGQELKNAEKEFEKWGTAQINPEYWNSSEYAKSDNKFWSGFALVRPLKMRGHQESIALVYGVDWLTTVAQSYHFCSLNAFMNVRDFIYEQSEVKSHIIARKDAKKQTSKNIDLSSDASSFYRLGLHRFPATLPEYLFNDKEEGKEETTVTVYDNVSLQEWTIKNLDALFGEFPLKIKYKNIDGEEQLLKVDNLAETLAELIGLSINIATDADTSVQLGFKNLVESTKAANSAIVAGDYARANSEYLGFNGKEKTRKVKLTYTPGKTNLIEALKESESNVVGFEIDEKESLKEQISKTLIVLQILKSASYFPWKPGDQITGDAIRDKRQEDKEKADQDWDEFLKDLNNPTGFRKIQGNPIPRVRDINTGETQND